MDGYGEAHRSIPGITATCRPPSCMVVPPRVKTDMPTIERGELTASFGRITDHFRGIYTIYLKLMKEKPEDVNM